MSIPPISVKSELRLIDRFIEAIEARATSYR
jgi:hypothetical protein